MDTTNKSAIEVFLTCYHYSQHRVKRKDKGRMKAIALVTAFRYYREMEKRFLNVFDYLQTLTIDAIMTRDKKTIVTLADAVQSFRDIIIENQKFYENLERRTL